jgi:hypothetical protein
MALAARIRMSDSSVTALLQAWKSGEAGAESALMSTLYPMLRELARNQLSSFLGVRTLQPTELVHEAYERLQRQQQVQWGGHRAGQPQPQGNTGGDGQAKSGSAGEEKSPGSGRSTVSPVDTGGARVTPAGTWPWASGRWLV